MPDRTATIGTMLDNDAIRHRNVRLLVDQLERRAHKSGARAGGIVMLAKQLNKGAPQVQHFAGKNPIKPIGKQLAREIESAFNLEHGWMDWPQWGAEESQPLRLEPDMLADTVRMFRAMERPGGRAYTIEDIQNDPEVFVEAYRHLVEVSAPVKSHTVVASAEIRKDAGRVHDKAGGGPTRKKVGTGGRGGT